MAVALDASGTAKTGTAAVTLTEGASSLTVGAGANRALALLMQFGGLVTNVTAFWDEAGTNQAMTQIGKQAESDNLASTYIFGLIAPTSGAKLLKVSWTTSVSWTYCMASFTGADQASVQGTFKNFISGNPASTASASNAAYPPGGASINSPVNDFCILGAGSNNQGFALTTGGTGQVGTFLYGLNTNVSGAGVFVTGAGASTALSVSALQNSNVAQPCCWAACDIAAVGAAAKSVYAGLGIEDRSADLVRQINKTIMVPYY
jgi:hypothetical protein